MVLIFPSELNLVLVPSLYVLLLLFVTEFLREKLIEGKSHPILIHACVGHNSEIDCTLVFF